MHQHKQSGKIFEVEVVDLNHEGEGCAPVGRLLQNLGKHAHSGYSQGKEAEGKVRKEVLNQQILALNLSKQILSPRL
jgi:hypothetical protein